MRDYNENRTSLRGCMRESENVSFLWGYTNRYATFSREYTFVSYAPSISDESYARKAKMTRTEMWMWSTCAHDACACVFREVHER